MAGKKTTQAQPASAPQQEMAGRKRWVKLTPRDHVLKQIEIQRELVEALRTQLQKEEQTLQGMEKAKEFFPA
jgi:hypothetical protein